MIDWLVQLKKEGKIKGRVAAINIGIELGVEMANAFAKLAPKAGLDLVFNKSYPPDVAGSAAAACARSWRPIRTLSSPSAIRRTPSW